jgi:superfamily II DNA or RNA helicase
MTIQPFPFQRKSLNEIYDMFKTKRRILYQLSTAGGKTFIFSFLTKFWIDKYDKRVLILCHRIELVKQTVDSLNKIGVSCEAVTSKTNYLKHHSMVYVAMIETAYNRLQRDKLFFKNVNLVIADECHILIFDKVFDYFPSAKILGCSATPVVLKRIKFWRCKHCKNTFDGSSICCDEEVDEWSRPFTLSEIYEDIVIGPPVDELIKMNRLVRELSFIENYIDQSKLETDSDGEVTVKSADAQYGSEDAVFNVLLNYEKLCKGKKTMIFNNSAKTNLILYQKFLEAGHNVRMFDSINKQQSGKREDVIKWFKDPQNRDCVLLNVGVFTTGFDVTDVEAIMLNISTNSLSLFIQIVGRGVRATDVIYKDHCVVVDGGGNIDRHQEFSDPTRDWKKIFFKGQGKEKCKREDAFDIQTCEECGTLYSKQEPTCPECGSEIIPKPKPVKRESEAVLMPIRKIPPPNPESIYQYTLKKEEDVNFSFKIMEGQIVDMFKYYRVSEDLYSKTKSSGKLEKKITSMIRSCYFKLIDKPDIKAANNRTISHLQTRVLKRLDQYYGG